LVVSNFGDVLGIRTGSLGCVFKFLTEMFRDPSWFSNEDIQELAVVQQEDVQTSQPGFVGTCLGPTQLINDLEQLTTNGSWC